MNAIKNNEQIIFVRSKYKLSDDGLKIVSISTNVEMKLKSKDSVAVYVMRGKKYSYNFNYIRSLLKCDTLEYDNFLASVFLERFSLTNDGLIVRLSDQKIMSDDIKPIRFTVKNKGYRMPLFMAINILDAKDFASIEEPVITVDNKTVLTNGKVGTVKYKEINSKKLYKNPKEGEKKAFSFISNKIKPSNKIKNNFKEFCCILKGEEKLVRISNAYEIGFLFLLRNQAAINKNFK